MAHTFSYFGTDGIRGKVGESPITIDFILKLGWALGKAVSSKNEHPKVVIGKDTRISGYMLESALQAGLVSSGCDIMLSGPLATPGIAYLTRTFKADAGIVISASHNPFTDNGIKIFAQNGIKICDETQLKIEKNLSLELACVSADKLGKASRITDAVGRYVEFCKSSFPKNMSLKGQRIVVDCANGATYNTAPMVLAELGAEVIAIGDQPDGFNINQDYGSTEPAEAIKAVQKYRANLGLVMDGDGDRLLMIDRNGKLLDGDDLLYILTWFLHEQKALSGVIGTHMTNLGFELYCKQNDIDFARVNVGDRNIIHQLNERGWNLGAEPSGHIIHSDYSTTGDGIVSALQILAALQTHNIELHQATKSFSRVPQVTMNIPFLQPQREKVKKLITRFSQEGKGKIGDKGRTLIRCSGTEPVVRVMVEATDEKVANKICKELVEGLANDLAAK